MKLGLGTVQFGLDYGYTNKNGIPTEKEIKRIFDCALKNGVSYIDTANLYGNAEEIIGKFLPNKNHVKVITKTPKFSAKIIGTKELKDLEESLSSSLNKLKINKLYALLVHSSKDLHKDKGYLIYKKLVEFKDRNIIKNIGISCYSQQEVKKIIARYNIDLLQIPINILNQNMLESNFLDFLKEKKIEIHARSILLQGLLAEEIKKGMYPKKVIEEKVVNLKKYLKEKKISMIQASIKFVSQLNQVDVGVFGVLNDKQLLEIIEIHQSNIEKISLQKYALFRDENVNPSNWN